MEKSINNLKILHHITDATEPIYFHIILIKKYHQIKFFLELSKNLRNPKKCG